MEQAEAVRRVCRRTACAVPGEDWAGFWAYPAVLPAMSWFANHGMTCQPWHDLPTMA